MKENLKITEYDKKDGSGKGHSAKFEKEMKAEEKVMLTFESEIIPTEFNSPFGVLVSDRALCGHPDIPYSFWMSLPKDVKTAEGKDLEKGRTYCFIKNHKGHNERFRCLDITDEFKSVMMPEYKTGTLKMVLSPADKAFIAELSQPQNAALKKQFIQSDKFAEDLCEANGVDPKQLGLIRSQL